MNKITLSLLVLGAWFVNQCAYGQSGIITTVAGNGTIDTLAHNGQPAVSEGFWYPIVVAKDISGNILFSEYSNRIGKINSSGILSTVAGGNVFSFVPTGDGGPATAAALCYVSSLKTDKNGTIYFIDGAQHYIRKIDTSGIINTILYTPDMMGDQIDTIYTTTWPGFVGTPLIGIRIAADAMNLIFDIAPDKNGYIYFAKHSEINIYYHLFNSLGAQVGNIDTTYMYNQILKISPTGVISKVAGEILPNYYGAVYYDTISYYGSLSTPGTGDGGPATDAYLTPMFLNSLCLDTSGNLYITDETRIRKIDTFGIIQTIGGIGTAGFSGDGGPATSALLGKFISGLTMDDIGNLYFADSDRIRKINTAGIISTIAGTSDTGFAGDNGNALCSQFNFTNREGIGNVGMTFDNFSNLIVPDVNNHRIRKIDFTPTTILDSFSVFVTDHCDNVEFGILDNGIDSMQHIKTYFGDGTFMDTSFTSCGASFHHFYESPGTYSVRHVKYNGMVPVDSVIYAHSVSQCQNVSIKFYNDLLGTCIYNSSSDPLINLPVLVQIDSNGVTIDTVSAIGILNYLANGNPGDIYTFHVISVSSIYTITCPSSGFITDTLFNGSHNTKYFGFSCTSSTSFDLDVNAMINTGRHLQTMNIDVVNNYCMPENATLTVNFSPKYIYSNACPAPTLVTGNTITWNLTDVSSVTSPINFYVLLSVPDSLLTSGDTAHTEIIITPISGDTNITNNVIYSIDTIRGSFDPNEMSVSPSGYILPTTTLQYSIMFENTGNDTAHNIHVMDTLSDNVDIHSLRLVSSSATMAISIQHDSANHNIVKFDFPAINLLDSSHHGQCDGMVIFNINAIAGLWEGTAIYNHAGIFFDDNLPILTDTVVDVIANVHGDDNVCVGASTTLTTPVPNGMWSCSNANASVVSGIITGISAGVDTIYYTTNVNNIATFSKVITINPSPALSNLTGDSSVCTGAAITLTDTASGGTWNTANSHATIAGGIVTGMSVGIDTIVYSLSTSYCTTSVSKPITINLTPYAGSITGASSLCAGSSLTLGNAATGGTWSISNSNATLSGNTLSGITAGTDTVYYSVTNICGTATTNKIISINPLPFAGSISGDSSVCTGSVTMLTDAATGGTWSCSNTHASVSGGWVTGISSGSVVVTYSVANPCGTVFASHSLTVSPSNAGTISGATSVCTGATIALSDGVTGGTWTASNGHVTLSGNLVTGVSVGIDTITYTISNICGTYNTHKVITINTLPTAGAISGDSVVCVGAILTLSDASSAGIWSSSNTHAYVTGGHVSGMTAGSAIISYTVSNGCGHDIVTKSIVVNPLPNAGTITGLDSVCIGASVTLADAVSGGLWSYDNTTATDTGSVVTGINSGTGLLSYTTSNSCGIATTTKTIHVLPLPVCGIITGSDSLCAGTTITLSETATGGTWLSGSSTATVTVGGSSTEAIVTGITTGSDSIFYSVSNYCGIATTVKTVTILPLPLANVITGPSAVCIGAVITLIDETTGGNWYASNTHATVLDGITTGSSLGIDSIRYSVSNSCGIAYVSHIITVNPLPDAGTVAGSDSVCVGNTIMLTDAATGGIWSSGSSSVATVSGGVVTGVAIGADSIGYSVTNSCGMAVTYHTVSVLTLPSVSISGVNFACIGSSPDTLYGSPLSGTWSSTNGNTFVASNGVVTALIQGIDTVIYSVHNYCGTGTATIAITVPTNSFCDSVLGFQSTVKTEFFTVYPNPANTVIYFEFSETKEATIKITDILGRTMEELVIGNTPAQQQSPTTISINVKQYKPGNYIYQVITGDGVKSGMFTVE